MFGLVCTNTPSATPEFAEGSENQHNTWEPYHPLFNWWIVGGEACMYDLYHRAGIECSNFAGAGGGLRP